MPNQMKHTSCRICGQVFDDWTYEKMMFHVSKHAAAQEGQKTFEDFGDTN